MDKQLALGTRAGNATMPNPRSGNLLTAFSTLLCSGNAQTSLNRSIVHRLGWHHGDGNVQSDGSCFDVNHSLPVRMVRCFSRSHRSSLMNMFDSLGAQCNSTRSSLGSYIVAIEGYSMQQVVSLGISVLGSYGW